VAAGIVVFVLLMTAGYVYSSRLDPQWTARANVLVLPAQPVDPDHVPAYYETLSRGQMVQTLAELVRLGEFQADAGDRYGLTDEQREAVDVEVIVVADTAMVQVMATAADPNLAVAMVDGVVDLSTKYVADLSLPYALVPVGEADNNVTEESISRGLVVVVFLLVAIGLGIAYQQAIYRLAWLAKRRQPQTSDVDSPDADPLDAERVTSATVPAKDTDLDTEALDPAES
jgi:hypothetical protein